MKASDITLVLLGALALVACAGDSPDDPGVQLCNVLAVGSPESIDEAKSLIEQGADVNRQFRSEGDYTCLMALSSSSYVPGVELLLEAGADPNLEAQDGRTALTIAAKAGDEEVVRLLIEHGAIVGHRTHAGRSALDIATENGHDDVAALLRAAGAEP